jgi:hypothetical protein
MSIRSTRGEGNTRVTLAGIVVDEPQQGVRPGTRIAQSRVPIVTLRERADGTKYLKLSEEADAFLALRGAPMVPGLDADPETGEVLSVLALRHRAYEDLQAYLNAQPTPVHAVAETPAQLELLPDAPLA